MPRKLASIQVIHSFNLIEGADRIEQAMVMGWQVVVPKGEFSHAEQVVFFEIDAILPADAEWAQFLAEKEYRVKTCKLRGTLSQGLALPLSILPEDFQVETGADVTAVLEVKKYERLSEAESGMHAQSKGNFPSFISKTDEPRVQSSKSLLYALQGQPYYITEKIDGTSATFAKVDNQLIVASRNLEQKDGESNTYWNIARQYNLEENLPEGFAIQGEIAGTDIQKNRLCLQGHRLFVFNVFNIKKGKWLRWNAVKVFCDQLDLQTVKEIEIGGNFDKTQEDLLEMAKGKYHKTKNHREGIVVRSLDKRISFKVINNDFLLKEEK